MFGTSSRITQHCKTLKHYPDTLLSNFTIIHFAITHAYGRRGRCLWHCSDSSEALLRLRRRVHIRRHILLSVSTWRHHDSPPDHRVSAHLRFTYFITRRSLSAAVHSITSFYTIHYDRRASREQNWQVAVKTHRLPFQLEDWITSPEFPGAKFVDKLH